MRYLGDCRVMNLGVQSMWEIPEIFMDLWQDLKS